MFHLITVLVALALAFPVIAVVALVKVLGFGSLLQRLELRVLALERHLAPAVVSPVQAEPQPAPPPPQAAAPVEPPPPPSAPPAPSPPQPTSVPPAPVPRPPPLPPAPIGFEERFGTRWVVWIGGLALALGGIFLVRYTIQQGLIGPGVRIILGALLALGLVAAGEWSRRAENLSGLPGLPSAHIPSILTAAGTTVGYATVYAAYALYGFLPPAVAFILLGVVALLTLAAALLHGPALAGLGVVGAYLAPLLVASAKPDYWSLYVYIAVVTAAAFALARFRLWPGSRSQHSCSARCGRSREPVSTRLRRLAPTCSTPSPASRSPRHSSSAVCSMVRPARPTKSTACRRSRCRDIFWSRHSLCLQADTTPWLSRPLWCLPVATVVIAWRTEAATGAVPVAAILAMAVMADWAVQMNVSALMQPSGVTAPAIPEPQRFAYGWHLVLAAGWAAMFGIAGFMAQGRSAHAFVPMLWCASAVFTPLAMLIALYYRIAALDRSLPFAALALLLAAINMVATESLVRRDPRPGLMAASAMFATGALAALALALTFALEKGWLTVGLSLMVPGAAWVAQKRPLPWLRWLAAIMVVVVVARVAYDPRIIGTDIGRTPIFNWLLYGYGIPAAAFWLGGWLLRRSADDLPARIVDAGAILFTVLLAILEIRHYVTGGNIYRRSSGFTEIALYVNVGLAMTIGLERVRGRTGSVVHNVGALVIAALTLLAIGFELASVVGPRFSLRPVGGPFFNLILLGFGVPAVLAITLALIARTTRPMPYRVGAAITAVTLALFYLTFEVRRLFHGPILAGPTTDAEQYSYSTVWLAFGIVLLAVGFTLRSQPARLLALGVIALTIAKVFIIDTASISGIYRALSVIGLGVVLLGIGWVYQRLLYPQAQSSTTAPAA